MGQQNKLLGNSQCEIFLFEKKLFENDYLNHLKRVKNGQGFDELEKMKSSLDLDREDKDFFLFKKNYYSPPKKSFQMSFLACYKDCLNDGDPVNWIFKSLEESTPLSIIDYGIHYYSSYFKDSWYQKPSISFSNDFLESVFSEEQLSNYFFNPVASQVVFTRLYHDEIEFDVDGMMIFPYQITPSIAEKLLLHLKIEKKDEFEYSDDIEFKMLLKILNLTINEETITILYHHFD